MSQLEISNMAIGLVGGKQLVTLTDDTVEAEQCDLFYDVARRFCLESRDWTFASTYSLQEALLPPLPPGIFASEFSQVFDIPDECLVIRTVSQDDNLITPAVYQKDFQYLYSDNDTLYIRYTKDTTLTERFSPTFRTALAHKLAELIAPGVTGDKTLKRELMVDAESLLENGGAIDGMQGTPKRTRASQLVGARYRGGRSVIGPYVE